jgi:hypothetical protein
MTLPASTTYDDQAQIDKGLVPLTIGVTGHRDLVASEIPRIEARVRDLFEDLRARFPDRPLRILSPLAEGADRLVARWRRPWRPLTVPLPMPMAIYLELCRRSVATRFRPARARRCRANFRWRGRPCPLGRAQTIAIGNTLWPEYSYARTVICCWRSGTASRLRTSVELQVIAFHHRLHGFNLRPA